MFVRFLPARLNLHKYMFASCKISRLAFKIIRDKEEHAVKLKYEETFRHQNVFVLQVINITTEK